MPDMDVRKAFRVLATHEFEGLSLEEVIDLQKKINKKVYDLYLEKQRVCEHRFHSQPYYEPICSKCDITQTVYKLNTQGRG